MARSLFHMVLAEINNVKILWQAKFKTIMSTTEWNPLNIVFM